ncbi:MAG: class A beta-lactamase [Marinifilaceae bacterium]
MKSLFLVLITLFVGMQPALPQLHQLKKEIKDIVANKRIKLGIAVEDMSTGRTFAMHGKHHFPMQSVYKFPIAVAAMRAIEEGKFNLTDSLRFDERNLNQDTWSPIRERYPNGVSLPISEIITYMVAHSDNCATDVIFDLLGGPAHVQQTIDGMGAKNIHVRNTEQEMQSSPEVQFQNYTTPKDMLQFIKQFASGSLLNEQSNTFLWQVMCATSTGSFIRHIPGDVWIARKTGTSGKDAKGIIAAQNDVGIIKFENGKQIAYAVFITDSAEGYDINADIIAQIGKAIYTYFKN